jgi:hypothetical protein
MEAGGGGAGGGGSGNGSIVVVDARPAGHPLAAPPAPPSPGIVIVEDIEDLTERHFFELLESRGTSLHWRCLGCNATFFGSVTSRGRAHLLRIALRGVALCTRRPKTLLTTSGEEEVDVVSILQPREDAAIQAAQARRASRESAANDSAAMRTQRLTTQAPENNRMQRAFANTPLAITLPEVHEAFALAFISNGIPAAVANDPRFRDAINKVAIYGRSYTHFDRHSIRKIHAPSLLAVTTTARDNKQRAAAKYGNAQASDGAKGTAGIPWMVFLDLGAHYDFMMDAIDTSGIVKSMQWLCDQHYKIYLQMRETTGDSKNTDLLLVDGACKSLLSLWEAKCPWSTGALCVPHSESLAIGDVFARDWAAVLYNSSLKNIQFIHNHDKIRSLFMEKAAEHNPTLTTRQFPVGHPQRVGKVLTVSADTRMATYVYSIASEVDADRALTATVTDPRFLEALRGQSWRDVGYAVRTDVLDREIAEEKACLVRVFEPMIELLRLADSNKPVMSKLYYALMSIPGRIKDIVDDCDPDIFPVERGIDMADLQEQRTAYMYNDYMGAGYALDPEYLTVDLTEVDPEVMKSLEKVVNRLFYDNNADVARFWTQFATYRGGNSPYKEPGRLLMAQSLSAHKFFEMAGSADPQLQYVGMRVCSKKAGIGAVERAHKKTKNVVHTKVRHSMRAPSVKTELLINFNQQSLDQMAERTWEEPGVDWVEEEEDDEPAFLPAGESTPSNQRNQPEPAAAAAAAVAANDDASEEKSDDDSDDDSDDEPILKLRRVCANT